MTEKMSKTDAVLYVIDTGKATIAECLKRHDARMSTIRREWLITVGATLDTARAEIERLAGDVEVKCRVISLVNADKNKLKEAVKQFEAMLPDNLGVCVSCKEVGEMPEDYVRERADLIGYAEDLDGRVCRDCCAEFGEQGRPVL